MTEEDEEQWEIMTPQRLKVNEWVPRMTGVITSLSALVMMFMVWHRRDRLFHRLVLGMALHMLVVGIFLMYGNAATESTATCTTQGFFLYVTSTTGMFYYGSLSIYSYVGILNNFEKSKIIWVEKYIHILVHIYPLGSAFYILTQQEFMSTTLGYCFLGNSPSDTSGTAIGLYCLSGFMVLLFPSIVMIVLFIKIKKRQEKIFIDATSFAKQAV